MSNVVKFGKPKSRSLSAVVKDAQGNVIRDYGVVSYWHRNFIINAAVNGWIKLKGLFR